MVSPGVQSDSVVFQTFANSNAMPYLLMSDCQTLVALYSSWYWFETRSDWKRTFRLFVDPEVIPAVITCELIFRSSFAGIPWTQTVPQDLVPSEDGFDFALTLIFFDSDDADLKIPEPATVALKLVEPTVLGVQANTATPPPPIVRTVCTFFPLAHRVTTRSTPNSQVVVFNEVFGHTATSMGFGTPAKTYFGEEI
jgi:hypothetical protein